MEFSRAVVTGATGVVGTALVRELLDRGRTVLVLIREDSPRRANLPEHGRLLVRDCSLEQLKGFENPEKEPWDTFFHLGWAHPKGAGRYDPRIQSKNIEYSLDAAECAKRLGCGQFVGAGSQAEYGRYDGVLTPETRECPENAYGIAKLCAGHMTREYCRQNGLQHIWTRIFSVYGPYDGENTLVTSLVRAFLEGRKPQCTEGGQIWDLLYSEDAARALYLAAGNGRGGRTYLIASGKAERLRTQIERIRDVLAPGAEIGFGEIPYAPRQVMHLEADISLTRDDLCFEPRFSLEEGIRRTAEALKRNDRGRL